MNTEQKSQLKIMREALGLFDETRSQWVILSEITDETIQKVYDDELEDDLADSLSKLQESCDRLEYYRKKLIGMLEDIKS